MPDSNDPPTSVGGLHTLRRGRQIKLAPNERIVQAWRAGSWDPGVYSIAKFELVEQASGTRIVFYHTGFPKGAAEHLAARWKAHSREPLANLPAWDLPRARGDPNEECL